MRFLLVSVVLLCIHPRAAGAQVIPGVALGRADARGEADAYRSRVHDELTAVLSEWSRLAERRDSVALAALYTEGAKASATGADDAIGPHGVVRQLWALRFGGAQVYATVDDFDTSGDFGYVAGSLTLQPTSSGGPLATTEARVVFILLRDFRGRWHIRHQSIVLPARLDSPQGPGHL